MTDADSFTNTYIERLIDACNGMPIGVCAGIDPSPESCSLVTTSQRSYSSAREATAAHMRELSFAIIDGARAGGAVAVKPQMAWFEHAGAAGIDALASVVEYAQSAGLLVVLDGKRGDVPHTARVYAEAYLGHDATSGIHADAMTVNAWVGRDSLAAMNDVARRRGCFIYALLLTSNPGSADLALVTDQSNTPWWHHVAGIIRDLDAGAVVGATRPRQLAEAASLLPDTPLLVPGLGAQGGSLTDVILHAGNPGAPALVTASRSLLPGTADDTEHLTAHVAAAVAAMVDQGHQACRTEQSL